MAITIVLMNGIADGQGAGGWMETLLQVVSVTMGILALCVVLVWVTQEEQATPRLSTCRRTLQPTPNYWLAKIRWAMGRTGGWLSRISKPRIEPCGECSGRHEASLWGNQREQGPRTGSAFRPKKCEGTDTESPVFPTLWKNPNKFSKTPTTDPETPGAAQPYHNLSQGEGATLGNTGTGARNLNPKGEGDPGTPGSIPVGPRNRNLAQEQAGARSSVAPGTVGPEATGRGQPKPTHPKQRARIPAVGGKNGHRE
ncbi:hypothetical protein K438DRAFT_1752436 [Mycena galopus ATCC 62051]|nr:hypothetical protein K438DRAFT_1752436 [Mycena galopus ATCC 62051]